MYCFDGGQPGRFHLEDTRPYVASLAPSGPLTPCNSSTILDTSHAIHSHPTTLAIISDGTLTTSLPGLRFTHHFFFPPPPEFQLQLTQLGCSSLFPSSDDGLPHPTHVPHPSAELTQAHSNPLGGPSSGYLDPMADPNHSYAHEHGQSFLSGMGLGAGSRGDTYSTSITRRFTTSSSACSALPSPHKKSGHSVAKVGHTCTRKPSSGKRTASFTNFQLSNRRGAYVLNGHTSS